MRKTTLHTLLLLSILAPNVISVAQKSEPIPPDMMGTRGTVVGFVRDIGCLLRNKDATVITPQRDKNGKLVTSDEVTKCIRDCVREGSPLAILTKKGDLYIPLSAEIPDKDARKQLLPYAGKYVRATGRLFERGGTHAVAIEKIETVSNW